MKILLLLVGKTDENYLEIGIEKYVERIRHFLPFEIGVIADLKNRKTLSFDQQKKLEGELILSKLDAGDFLVLLDENGRSFNSHGFADFIDKQMNLGCKRLVFVIGGPYGFSEAVYQQAQCKISLSSMTFSHQLVRLIFVEQLYRAFTIIKGLPYHHD